MSAEPTVSQREFDEYKDHQRELREADTRERAQLRDGLKELKDQRDDDIKTARQVRIAAIAAGASVVAAWVGLFELWHSLVH